MSEPIRFRVRATARKAIVVASPIPVAGVTPDSQHGSLITTAPDKVRVRAAQRPRAVAVRSPERIAAAVRGGGERVILVPIRGIPGPPGVSDKLTLDRQTTYALSGQRAVTADDAGDLIYATSDDLDHVSRPVWLTLGAWGPAVLATVLAEGQATEPGWSWIPGVPIWLGINGVLTQSIPSGALFVRELAEVVDPQTITFRPQSPITRG